MNREANEPVDEYKEKAVNRLTLGCMIIVALAVITVFVIIILTVLGIAHPFGIGEVCK
jgi:type IV secretory pathway component VirB8